MGKKEAYGVPVSLFVINTRDGTRTRTAVKPADFKSAMSTIPSPEPKEPRLAAGAPWSFALFAKGDFRRKLRGASQHFSPSK